MKSPTGSLQTSSGAAVWKTFFSTALILAAGLFVYWPSLQGPFEGDDVFYLVNNPLLHDPARLWKAWFSPGSFIEYYPLEQTVQYFQWLAWGPNTPGYHLTNIGLHLVSALLVWRLLAKFHLRFAWLGGLLFAIHPMQVESVAWISELKNTLSLPPLLLAMGFWIDYVEKGARRYYYWALACFFIALLCKGSVTPFPAVLLLYAWWKDGRLTWRQVGESLPFFALAIALGVLTILSGHWYTQHTTTTFASELNIGPFWSRLALAGTSATAYVAHVVWPMQPVPYYELWSVNPPAWWHLLPWIAFVLAGLFLWAKRATWGRHVILGGGFFLLFLAPILGFFAISFMQTTWVMDHFLYIAIIGPIGLAVAALDDVEKKIAPSSRPFLLAGVGALAVALAWKSYVYAGIFSNPPKLYAYVFRVSPGAWIAHEQYGQYLLQQNHSGEALGQFELALRAKPDYPTTHHLFALALVQQRRLPEANAQFEEAIRLLPTFAPFYNDYGAALVRQNRTGEGIACFRKALELAPEMAKAHSNLGSALAEQGDLAQAIAEYQTALKIEPDSVSTHMNLGLALVQANQKQEAAQEFEEVLRLDPGKAQAREQLGEIEKR